MELEALIRVRSIRRVYKLVHRRGRREDRKATLSGTLLFVWPDGYCVRRGAEEKGEEGSRVARAEQRMGKERIPE